MDGKRVIELVHDRYVKCRIMAKPAGTLNDQEMMFVISECSSHMDIAVTWT